MHSSMYKLKWLKLLCVMTVAVTALTACALGEDLEKEYTAKAQKGDPEAQYQLARLYFEANGVTHSDKKGELWLRKAAEQGYAQAQSDMGTMYATGLIVRQSAVEADKWYILSSRQGFGPGLRNMKTHERSMSQEQIREATALADDWKVKAK